MTEAQQAFDFTRTHSRRGDPATSKAAARDAARFSASQMGRVLQALKEWGPAGKTRIAQHCGLNDVQVARRCADLYRLSLAKPLDATEPSAAGKPERLWVAV